MSPCSSPAGPTDQADNQPVDSVFRILDADLSRAGRRPRRQGPNGSTRSPHARSNTASSSARICRSSWSTSPARPSATRQASSSASRSSSAMSRWRSRAREALAGKRKTRSRRAPRGHHRARDPQPARLGVQPPLPHGRGIHAGRKRAVPAARQTRAHPRHPDQPRHAFSLYRESQGPRRYRPQGHARHPSCCCWTAALPRSASPSSPTSPPSLVIHGFPAELRQVFTNLLTNAAEASGPGNRHPAARLRMPRRPRRKRLAARSRGPASPSPTRAPDVAEEIKAALFQPFLTTKGERGTGLGLWVCRGIVNKHGGAIDLAKQLPTPMHHGTTAQRLSRHQPRHPRRRRLGSTLTLQPAPPARFTATSARLPAHPSRRLRRSSASQTAPHPARSRSPAPLLPSAEHKIQPHPHPSGAKITIFVSHRRQVNLHRRHRRHALRQQPRVRMVLASPCGTSFERNQPRRRQHARLPHPAAQRLAIDPRLAIASREPTSIDPTGAPSPFDRQNITVSNPASARHVIPSAVRRIEHPRAVEVRRQPAACAPAQISSQTASGVTVPPAMLCRVLTPDQPRLRPVIDLRSKRRLQSTFQVRIPRSATTVRGMHPQYAATIAISQSRMCARDSQITSCPCSVWIRAAIRFPIDPVGTKMDASRPNTSAARASSRLTVGSSPYTSSPTSAFAMASPHGWCRLRHSVTAQIDHHLLQKLSPFTQRRAMAPSPSQQPPKHFIRRHPPRPVSQSPPIRHPHNPASTISLPRPASRSPARRQTPVASRKRHPLHQPEPEKQRLLERRSTPTVPTRLLRCHALHLAPIRPPHATGPIPQHRVRIQPKPQVIAPVPSTCGCAATARRPARSLKSHTALTPAAVQPLARRGVPVRHAVVRRQRPRPVAHTARAAIPCPAASPHPPPACTGSHAPPRFKRLLHRVPPARLRLVRQPHDQVKPKPLARPPPASAAALPGSRARVRASHAAHSASTKLCTPKLSRFTPALWNASSAASRHLPRRTLPP